MNNAWIKPAVLVSVFAVFFAWENCCPRSVYLGRSIRTVLRHSLDNGLAGILSGALGMCIFFIIGNRVILWSAGSLSGFVFFLPDDALLRSFFLFLCLDLWTYWWHRLNHAVPLLWLFHRAHHCDTSMDASTSFRFHPVEIILSGFLRLPLYAASGMNLQMLAVYEIVLTGMVIFQHSNIALPVQLDRSVRMLLVTPRMHLIHHSPLRADTDSNYSSVFSFWDRIFKSYRMHDAEIDSVGLSVFRESRFQHFTGMLAVPFISLRRKQ